MKNFKQQVYDWVAKIPAGKVATYGQIALLIGTPRAARQVGWMLRGLGLDEKKTPWWRVVNKQGFLSIDHGEGGIEKQLQMELLKSEGIIFDQNFYIKDMPKFLWEGEE